MNSGGSTDCAGEDAAQIEQRNGFAKREDSERWCVASSVESPSALKYLGSTRINILRDVAERRNPGWLWKLAHGR
jgi:hypothetical protein